ncbi:MAG: glycine cleavage system aminomethyltransferase GcvT [Pseudomonadota bacterium]
MADTETGPLKKTALHGLWARLGAKMTPFAGYEMPVQFAPGVLKEHLHVRAEAGLFDVSHMGQATIRMPRIGDDPEAAHAAVAAALERVSPSDIRGLRPGRLKYSVLLNEAGGIVDDFIVARPADVSQSGALHLVLNASRVAADIAHLRASLGPDVAVELHDGLSLLALQGPAAAEALAQEVPAAGELPFMAGARYQWRGASLSVNRCGYTGEDGFEISVPDADALAFAEALLAQKTVAPIGLGARDSLRLEAGLCLYGSDIDDATSPVEADLTFCISKRRRADGDFLGADRILRELEAGPERLRVGLRPDGRAPARQGVAIETLEGAPVGVVTSGAFGPSADGPISMGYVRASAAALDAPLNLMVRGRAAPARVSPTPFVPHRYYRKQR